MLRISADTLQKEQSTCETLRDLLEKAQAAESDGKDDGSDYVLESGILLKKQRNHRGEVSKLIVIPLKFRDQIMKLCHSGYSAHVGITKTKDRLLRNIFWPGCYWQIDEYVRSCDVCQRVGRGREKTKAPLKLVPIIGEIFTKVNIDLCGPLPESEKGHKYLLTLICLSSKYAEAIPLTDSGSLAVTDALLQIFSRIGFPKEVQCDNGTSFTSNLTSEFFDRLGIKVTHSSILHPQSNPVERYHKSLKKLLRALCLEAGPEWERHLPAALFALRTVTHESTGFSPAELVFGRNLRTPETLLYEHWMEPQEENTLVTEHVFSILNRLKCSQELAVKKMAEMQQKRKVWYDRNTVKREFKPGDSVLILATAKPNKLAAQWIGPGVIEAKISETNYIVRLGGPRERTKIYHVNMIKPYHRRPEMINLVLHKEEGESLEEPEWDFPHLSLDPNVFDFSEITRDGNLESRLDATQIDQLRKLLVRHSKVFSNTPGLTDLVTHDIELTSDKIVRLRPYKSSRRQTEILRTEVEKMLKLGVIEVGESEYASPLILVETHGRDPRPCIDYRKLNEIIRTEYFPLPNLEERVERVASATYITIFDLSKGYWQIPLSPRAQRIAAFVTPFGAYRPLRLSFGLRNAPYFFSKLMADLLKGCEEFAVPYLDDIAIFSSDWISHLKHVEEVLKRIQGAKLTIKPSKCRFAQNQVKYLGHIVGNGMRSPAEAKVKCIQDFPRPKNKTQVRAFLGLVGYYSHYIADFAAIAAPLTDALKGKEKRGEIHWDEKCENAFSSLKSKLASPPVLCAPDFEKPFIVQCDASD